MDDVQSLRAAARARAANRPRGPALHVVEDRHTGSGLPLRLYRPSRDARPGVIFAHGGGFVVGDLDTHDAICRRLAKIGGVTVVAVHYRRAPEHCAPAAVDDVYEAAGWVLRNTADLGVDPAPGLGLAGDSAGGTIAVLAAVRLRAQDLHLSTLLLAYPNADVTLSQPSIEAQGRGQGLETEELRWFIDQWLPDHAMRLDPSVSPLHAELAGLPPTIVATAQHDPLHDEGVLLAERLHDAGVEVRHVAHPSLAHGFLGMAHESAEAAEAVTGLFEQLGELIQARSGLD